MVFLQGNHQIYTVLDSVCIRFWPTLCICIQTANWLHPCRLLPMLAIICSGPFISHCYSGLIMTPAQANNLSPAAACCPCHSVVALHCAPLDVTCMESARVCMPACLHCIWMSIAESSTYALHLNVTCRVRHLCIAFGCYLQSLPLVHCILNLDVTCIEFARVCMSACLHCIWMSLAESATFALHLGVTCIESARVCMPACLHCRLNVALSSAIPELQ